MADVSTKWVLNLVDKVSNPLKKVQHGIERATKSSKGLSQSFNAIALRAVAFQQIGQTFTQLGNDIDQAVAPGVAFQTSMKDLAAITGATGKQLELMEANARSLAKTYGGEAAGSVEVYKLLLSQLGPALADTPDILNQMAENVSLLSKTMGGDTTGAVEVLTTAMNQYGVSLDDPVKAQEEMARMMNAMSAGAKEGSAELPALKAAIQNVGGDAKRANVSFEEMVSSIEALDKAGKKGAEGGVALRNVLSTLSQGRFLPKKVQEELTAAGVDITRLSDKSLRFTDRLRELQKVSGDSALITKLFGKENQLAAAALIDSVDNIDQMTTAVTGTTTTMEQSQVVMGSFSERMSRLNARFKDLGISLFNATKGFLPFIQGSIQGVGILARLAGALEGVKLILGGFSKAIRGVGRAFGWAGRQALTFGKWVVLTGLNALKASGRFVIAALQGLGSFAVSLISATAAQIGLNIAMTANPIGLIIVGIALAIAAVAALIKYWDQIKMAIWNFIKWIAKNNPFAWLINIVDKVFPGFKQALVDFFGGIYDWIVKWASKVWDTVKGLWDSIIGIFGFGDDDEATIKVQGDGTATSDPDPTKAQQSGEAGKDKPKQKDGNEPFASLFGGANTDPHAVTPTPITSLAPAGGAGQGTAKARSITMNLEVTNHFTLSENLEQRLEEIKEKITELFVDSGRDAAVALG